MNLEEIKENITHCKACELHKLIPVGCTPIAGHGKIGGIMLIGEAPGETEIELGRPFVGLCGRLLDQILNQAGLNRDDLYIANVVNCRPHNNGKNRPPSKTEINVCKGWLWPQIKFVQPTLIFTLGNTPTKLLLSDKIGKTFKLKDVIGKRYTVDFINCPIVPLYHPSFLLQYGRKYTYETVQNIKNNISGLSS